MAMLYSDPAIQVNEQRVFVIRPDGVKSYNIDEIRAVRLVNEFTGPGMWRRWWKWMRLPLLWLGAFALVAILSLLVQRAGFEAGSGSLWGLLAVFSIILVIVLGGRMNRLMNSYFNSVVWTLQFDTPSGMVDVLSQRGNALALSKAKKAVEQAIKRQHSAAGISVR